MSAIESQFVIKNCPFCGGQGKLYKINSEAYVIRCENPVCKAEQIIFRSEEAAVQMWNRRTVTSERPKEEWVKEWMQKRGKMIDGDCLANAIREQERKIMLANGKNGDLFGTISSRVISELNEVLQMIEKLQKENEE